MKINLLACLIVLVASITCRASEGPASGIEHRSTGKEPLDPFITQLITHAEKGSKYVERYLRKNGEDSGKESGQDSSDENSDGDSGDKKSKKTINYQDNQGRTALHYAVETDNVKAVLGLLCAGADTKVYDKQRNAPIDLLGKISLEFSEGSFKDVAKKRAQIAWMWLNEPDCDSQKDENEYLTAMRVGIRAVELMLQADELEKKSNPGSESMIGQMLPAMVQSVTGSHQFPNAQPFFDHMAAREAGRTPLHEAAQREVARMDAAVQTSTQRHKVKRVNAAVQPATEQQDSSCNWCCLLPLIGAGFLLASYGLSSSAAAGSM